MHAAKWKSADSACPEHRREVPREESRALLQACPNHLEGSLTPFCRGMKGRRAPDEQVALEAAARQLLVRCVIAVLRSTSVGACRHSACPR